ncbi:histidine phosphatase family protein [Psychrobacter lutiphocae]|uniref:histidine phosphatase family protein n=1 Tax=Psychrobacter lutiphocae TaxID=540500 RepID=UPI00036EFC6B|nr:histidine phosphatase family protein [Psychrobacter lutiphocae]
MILYIWRHPKPIDSTGLCFGQTDVTVDKRKLKRLANQILSYVKKHQLPKVIWVSDLQRSKQVGQLLISHGFKCHIEPRLAECNFGAWEGVPWSNIAKSDIDNWCENFAEFAPTEGESLSHLFARVEGWIIERQTAVNNREVPQQAEPILAIGHAGWITTAKMIAAGQDIPKKAVNWPRPVGYGELTILTFIII